MQVDYIDPAIVPPLATVLWLMVIVPVFARWNRARRRERNRGY